MTEVQVAVVGHEAVMFDLAQISTRAQTQTTAVVRHYGHLLRTAVMRNVSGSPVGVVTGDYRRSITVTFPSTGIGSLSAEVGSNAPQSRRLEFGFVGADSLGRIYNQAPRPHFGPAFDDVVPDFVAALERVVDG